MKKVFAILSLMLLASFGLQAQNGGDQGYINRARAAAIQAGCLSGSENATVTGTVNPLRVPCGESISGIGHAVYLYMPTPCPPQAEICIQVIVPVAEVIFGCDNEILSVNCLDLGN